MALILLAIGAIGHAVLWMTLINRSHGLGIRRKWINLITVVCLAAGAFLPFVVAAILIFGFVPSVAPIAWGYVILCCGVSLWAVVERIRWLRHPERGIAPASNHTSRIVLPAPTGTYFAAGMPRLLGRLPGNEVLDVHIQEKELAIPRLAAEHDGLRLVHLTDLHISGRVNLAFFEQVAEQINAAKADLVAVTGDLVEGDQFLDWIPTALGRLRAKYGVYYVLGNHDRRATESKLKAALADAGLNYVGGAWREIIVNGAPLVLAGNELPWYKPAADMRDCPSHSEVGGPTRILLAHSPDQFRWAESNDFDLMLAGHLHGGQVRLPMVGAIASPSVHGVRYVNGLFARGNTVMHVSRGVGSLTPVRFLCPPEIAILKLRRVKQT